MEKYKLNPITQDMDIVGEGAGDVINNYGVSWNDEDPLPPQELAWGDITGDIEDQADLAEALNGKADKTEIPSLAPYRTSTGQDAIDAAKLPKPSAEGVAGQVLTTDGEGGVSWETPQGGGLPSGGIAGQVLVKNSSTDGDASWRTLGELVTVSLMYQSKSTEQPSALPANLHPIVQIVNADDETDVIAQSQWNGVALTFSVSEKVHYKVKFGSLEGYTTPSTSIEYIATLFNTNSVQATYVNARVQQLGVMIMRDDNQFYFADEWNTDWNNRAVGVSIADIHHNILIAPIDSGNSLLCGYRSAPVKDPDTGKEYTNKCLNAISASNDWASTKNTDCLIYSFGVGHLAGTARSYVWKDGTNGADMPSGGQLNFIKDNITDINEALTAIGGTNIDVASNYWSSSYYGNPSDGCTAWMMANGTLQARIVQYHSGAARPVINLPDIINI